MTDELIRRFDPPAPHGITALARKPVVQPLLMILKIPDQFGDRRGGLGIRRLHPLQAPDDVGHFAPEEPRQGGFVPFACCRSGCAPYGSAATLWRCSRQW